MIEISRE